jgi:tetratricopeptide (TPR) repeat protein
MIITTLILAVALPAWAQRRRQIKDAGALLTSAKIAMLANPPRYDEAMDLCNQVLSDNGPVAEAYFRRGSIYGEFATKEYDLGKKLEHVRQMALNFDSLHFCCDNEEIKRKFRKGCKNFGKDSDSMRVYFWRENYNEGVNVIANLDNVHMPDLSGAVDSASEAMARNSVAAAADSCIHYFLMAFTVDSSKYRPLEGVGIVYDRLNKYDSSAYWFIQAHNIEPDSMDIIQNIAYAYIQAQDWENALIWLLKFHEYVPEETSVLSNIAIVHNRLENFDSAYYYNQKVLELAPDDAGANYDVGTYWLLKSQEYNEKATESRKAGNKDDAEQMDNLMNEALDSAAHYFKTAVENDPEDILYLEQSAVVSMIAGNYEEALGAFDKLIEINPTKDFYINKGDCLIQLKRFDEAIGPYEKAAEEDPGDFKVWEVLGDLYESNGMMDKAKEARDKAEELKNL